MFVQLKAGSWTSLGPHGILERTYATLAAAASEHFTGRIKRKIVLTADLGEMRGPQPLAVNTNDGLTLAVEIDKRAFFFSSRRRHTRFDCDWSSDVCSSD